MNSPFLFLSGNSTKTHYYTKQQVFFLYMHFLYTEMPCLAKAENEA